MCVAEKEILSYNNKNNKNSGDSQHYIQDPGKAGRRHLVTLLMLARAHACTGRTTCRAKWIIKMTIKMKNKYFCREFLAIKMRKRGMS